MSVWIVDSGDDESIKRVVAAMAATRNEFDAFDYQIFDIDILVDYQLVECDGDTPDSVLNSSKHRDIADLTAEMLGRLAAQMALRGECKRVQVPTVIRYVKESIDNCWMELSKITKLSPGALARIKIN